MAFKDLLEQYMRYKKLDEVAAACAARGVNVHPTYLSKLRTGSRPAPDDEHLVRTLAEVLGADPEMFWFAATVERRPQEVLLDTIAFVRALLAVAEDRMEGYKRALSQAAERLVAGNAPEEVTAYCQGIMAELAEKEESFRTMADGFTRLARQVYDFIDTEMLQRSFDFTQLELPPEPSPSEDELVATLAEVAGVPAAGLRAAIAAMRAVEAPDQENSP